MGVSLATRMTVIAAPPEVCVGCFATSQDVAVGLASWTFLSWWSSLD